MESELSLFYVFQRNALIASLKFIPGEPWNEPNKCHPVFPNENIAYIVFVHAVVQPRTILLSHTILPFLHVVLLLACAAKRSVQN